MHTNCFLFVSFVTEMDGARVSHSGQYHFALVDPSPCSYSRLIIRRNPQHRARNIKMTIGLVYCDDALPALTLDGLKNLQNLL
jgi:hypothetical protein